MKYDIFISYSTKDKDIADDVCCALENSGIKCWIAPRNIQPGAPYARAIINGINSAEILLLVLTHDSNESEHVINEVDIAFNAKKTIIPFFAEGVAMNPELNYYLSRKQWFIAYPNYRLFLDNLVKIIASNLKLDIAKPSHIGLSEPKFVINEIGTSNIVNGHEYVDLGLPSGLKWATCNVGANSPEEYGGYYAWGETEEKSNYNWSTYKWCNGSENSMTKYCTDSDNGTVDNKTVLDPEDDVAHVKWGGSWRMPTRAEQDELRNECTWSLTVQNGVNGYRVTGPNGNSIFLPAAGFRYSTSVLSEGSSGFYWLSSLDSYGSYCAYDLRFHDDNNDWMSSFRCYGQSVRPVCDRNT
ncbi:MAG: toll/interleukin-1 receptor domain-containing protein [Bacteroidaceae bacterium]|nr:toll/interleukin-1 receptor domain-containing protein [Bacteroidaceae bacterium]